jgi:hypothetical protein
VRPKNILDQINSVRKRAMSIQKSGFSDLVKKHPQRSAKLEEIKEINHQNIKKRFSFSPSKRLMKPLSFDNQINIK